MRSSFRKLAHFFPPLLTGPARFPHGTPLVRRSAQTISSPGAHGCRRRSLAQQTTSPADDNATLGGGGKTSADASHASTQKGTHTHEGREKPKFLLKMAQQVTYAAHDGRGRRSRAPRKLACPHKTHARTRSRTTPQTMGQTTQPLRRIDCESDLMERARERPGKRGESDAQKRPREMKGLRR